MAYSLRAIQQNSNTGQWRNFFLSPCSCPFQLFEGGPFSLTFSPTSGRTTEIGRSIYKTLNSKMKSMKTNDIKIENSRNPLQSALAEGASWLLASLFIYTAVSKVYDWQGTKLAMYNQLFPEWMADILLFLLPILELGIASMLLVSAWRKTGFLLSVLLLILFTVYVGWIGLGFAPRVPCSCGGVLNSLDWEEHLVFNLVFLGIAGNGLWFERRKSQLN